MAKFSESGNPSTSEESIRVNMLGDFKLRAGDREIDDGMTRSHKIWALLAYLIIHRQRNIPQKELIDTLWTDEDNDNPANALKTLLYRARAVLSPLFGEDIQLILSQRGSYSWNRKLECTIDAEEFDRLVTKAADRTLAEQLRKELYGQAMELYQQDFLPKLADQLWVISFTTYYHYLYLDSVFAYGALLFKDGEYGKLVNLCSQAVKIEPYEEKLYILLIRALLGQGNGVAALSHYETATDLLYRSLGVRPSAELRGLYQEIMKEQKLLETDLDVIQQDLKEVVSRPGPYFCEYGFFREAYRLEVRRTSRLGTTVQIALLTLAMTDGNVPGVSLLNKVMGQLMDIMQNCLRRGDVVARYSGSQYVLMLPSAVYEDAVMIVERIIDYFGQKNRKSFLTLSYKIQQLDLDKARAYH